MIISHDLKVIFVHVQKTGGNSVNDVLLSESHDHITRLPLDKKLFRTKHCFASDIKKHVDANIFNEYKKFAVVRNPWDRMVSWYSMFCDKTKPVNDTTKMVHRLSNSFEDFLNIPQEAGRGLAERFYVNQYDYVSDPNTGDILVDNILRFETLDDDFQKFIHEVGLSIKLPHKNKSKREGDYRQYYNERTKKIIAERFAKDIDFFRYFF